MKLHVRKGDTVVVIAGKDKGKTGKVLTAIPSDNAVVVEGVNIISRHKKPRNAQDKGGIMKAEGKISASNVQIICPVCGKATRVANTIIDGKKTRTCKKCGASLDVATKKATKKTATKTVKTEKAEKTEKPAKTTAKTTAKKTAVKDTTKTKKAATKTTSVAKSTRRVASNG